MQAASSPRSAFTTANPHALAVILEASETRRIIAARDIFDLSGIKLWARDQPVSAALQRKLMDRKLAEPMESCLMAEDGVTTPGLLQATWQLLEGSSPLAPLLRPQAKPLMQEVAHVPLHPVVQLLLTAAQASRPDSFAHAVQGMALAGALTLRRGGNLAEVRMALLAGLVHDLGEMYIDPHHGEADADRALDFTSYQQLVVHPHVGRLLLTQLTNYPASLARAVAEHHERLDGSGYPQALPGSELSPLGRLLAATEAVLAVMRGDSPSLARASVALRVVPGEFDMEWVGHVAEAARTEPELGRSHHPETLRERLLQLDGRLTAAWGCAEALEPAAGTQALRDTLAMARHLLQRLRTGWTASGLWCADAVAAAEIAELDAVEGELSFRLSAIERAARLRAGHLPEPDAKRLQLLLDSLQADVS